MLKAIEKCMDDAEKMHLIITQIKKYAIKACNVKTIKAYNNNMKKFHLYCQELTNVMGKNFKYCWISHNLKSKTSLNVPWKVGFIEYDDDGNFIRHLDCFVIISDNY